MSQPGEREERIAVVVGLGNPGKKYETTRHNVGFQVIDRLAEGLGVDLQERKFKANWGTGTSGGQKILLIKPLTFMNRSGEAVGEILRYFGFSPAQMLVVHDDLDLPKGRLRLVRGGGAGGHRGILSIMEHVSRAVFPRLKLGIGRPERREPVESFVLQPPYPEDEKAFGALVTQASEVVQAVLSCGLEDSMNRFNRRDAQPEPLSDSGR